VLARVGGATVVLVSAASVGAAWWLTTRPSIVLVEQAIGSELTVMEGLVGLAWVVTGAAIVWLRPRHAVGWLFVAVGSWLMVRAWQAGRLAPWKMRQEPGC